ncbi:Ribonuclease VapC22 [Rickettsiales bacterium Ac37b]|nr:Ribonuclease VapC22 [Rickettsiales bacterium Ac37b]
MNEKIILDTHILIWSLLDPTNLTNKIKDIIADAQNSDNLYISSITLWEIAMLISKKRINVYGRIADFLTNIEKIEGLTVLDINANIAAESIMLPGGFQGDPADCLIISTTRELASTLITRDQKIINWATQGYLKTIIG